LIVYSRALAGKHLRLFSLVFPCKVCKYRSCICGRINFGFPLQESCDFALIVRLPLHTLINILLIFASCTCRGDLKKKKKLMIKDWDFCATCRANAMWMCNPLTKTSIIQHGKHVLITLRTLFELIFC
jgi:hypothetical protein